MISESTSDLREHLNGLYSAIFVACDWLWNLLTMASRYSKYPTPSEFADIGTNEDYESPKAIQRRKRMLREGKMRKPRDIRLCQDEDGFVNTDFTFAHSFKQLSSLDADAFLGLRVFVEYFADAYQLQGILTCLGNSGQFRLDDVQLRGYAYGHLRRDEGCCYRELRQRLAYDLDDLATDSAPESWFHLTSTRKVYVDCCECTEARCRCHSRYQLEGTRWDITSLVMDVLKWKMVRNFLLTCSFKREQLADSPVTLLFNDRVESELKATEFASRYIDQLKAMELAEQDECRELARAFAYGRKQNAFSFVCADHTHSWTHCQVRRNAADAGRKSVRLRDEFVVALLLSYRDLLISFFCCNSAIPHNYLCRDILSFMCATMKAVLDFS